MRHYTDSNFQATNKKARVTFNGWDGKSYDGEAVNRTIHINPNLPGKQFVVAYNKGWKCYHLITEKLHPNTGANIVECYSCFEPYNN